MSTRFEGYHDEHNLPVKRGDRVTIVKGTVIRTTRPSNDRTGATGFYQTKVAGRNYRVKVDHVLNGVTYSEEFVRNRGNGEKAGHKRNPSVRWPGTGGYWFEVDINDLPEAKAPTHYVLDNGDVVSILHAGKELEDFIQLNFDASSDQETLREIHLLSPGQTYRGGGGAAPEWSLQAHADDPK